MGEQIDLPADVWKKLNIAWSIFLTLVGFLNIWVAQNFSEKTWALFKVFGIIGLMIVFIVAQGVYMSRFIKEQPEDAA